MKLEDLKSMKPDALIRFAIAKAEREMDTELNADLFPRKKIMTGKRSVRVLLEFPISYAPKKSVSVKAIEVNLKDDKVNLEYIRNPRTFDIKKRIPLYNHSEENQKLASIVSRAIRKNELIGKIVFQNGNGMAPNTSIIIRENNILIADISITIENKERNFTLGLMSSELNPTFVKELKRDPFYEIENFTIQIF